ncbi:MAG TPA: hypothetical protein VHC18_09490, partial [Amycolatopsis sp.]|nr:hypothetical protein [Amycolatopsis sp.]
MSAPQPPNQPWGGEQPQQGPPSGPQQQDNPFSSSEPTQVVQPGQSPGGAFGETAEPTQVVQPGQPPEGHGGGGEAPGAESTQLVPPGSQPPPAIPYAPPPSAADNPAALGQQQPGGFGQPQPPGGFGLPPQPGPYGQPPQGYGPPPGQPGGFGGPPGFGASPYGAPAGGGGGGNAQLIGWIAAGVVAVLGLIGAILMFTLMGDFGSGSSSGADQCRASLQQYGDTSICDQFEDAASAPAWAWIYTILLALGGLAAVGGGVLLFLKNKLASWVLVASGAILLIFSILFGAQAEFITRIVFTLIFGIVIGAIGALALIPSTAGFFGLGGPSGPGGFGGPPTGGYPGQPGGFGQPGPFGPPSGGFGQPGQPGPYG